VVVEVLLLVVVVLDVGSGAVELVDVELLDDDELLLVVVVVSGALVLLVVGATDELVVLVVGTSVVEDVELLVLVVGATLLVVVTVVVGTVVVLTVVVGAVVAVGHPTSIAGAARVATIFSSARPFFVMAPPAGPPRRTQYRVPLPLSITKAASVPGFGGTMASKSVPTLPLTRNFN
jgi:hypothetical protein